MNSLERLDHKAQALSRIITQYREARRLLAIVERKALIFQTLEDVLLYFEKLADIDLMEGYNLDVIGDIVGISRRIPKGVLLPFFGFNDTPAGENFGEEDNPAIGARFWNGEPNDLTSEPYTSTTVLGDPEYRRVIRAKIIKNHSHGTGDDILRSMEWLFPNTPRIVEDSGGMGFRIGIGRELSQVERVLITELDLLSRPNTVKLRGTITYFQDDFHFGFDDQTFARGFDDAANGGASFAEEI